MLLSIFHKILNFILPPVCPLCKTTVAFNKTLCHACWPKIQFISVPFCDQCAYTFDFGTAEEHQKCGRCLEKEPSFTQTRTAFKYDDFSKKLILSFKHGDAIYLGPLLAQWIYKTGQDVFKKADMLVPVPLHWTRLLKRGYNQAGILSKELSKLSNISTQLKVLKRIKRTASQGDLSKEQRYDNVKAAFKVNKKYKKFIQGKILILVDDVMTSGSTLEACAKMLLKAGAKEIKVLIAARVI